MYSRHDPNEYYVWRLKIKRSINQVWARVNESLRFNFESTLIIVSMPRESVQCSVFRVQQETFFPATDPS
jgi:hypothetical protein